MDPVTQIAVGAAAAATVSRPGNIRLALIVGGVAGGAPDLDIFIRSDEDPLLALQYHRHFTHSLFFAPVIGAIVAALFYFVWRAFRDVRFGELLKFGILGALTHGPIDACTSYGTLLYWPLSDHRESWDVISIIDPLFTPALLLALTLAFLLKKVAWARLGLIYCLLYLSFGHWQKVRAEGIIRDIASSQGHSIEQLSVRPSFANLVVWRLIYFDGAHYHINAVNLMPTQEPVVIGGETVRELSRDALATVIPPGSVQWRDFERFEFFSQGFVYQLPNDTDVIGDLRYAMSPEQVLPLWGIRLDPSSPDSHVTFEHFRDDAGAAFGRLWGMITRPEEF